MHWLYTFCYDNFTIEKYVAQARKAGNFKNLQETYFPEIAARFISQAILQAMSLRVLHYS